MKIEKLYLGLMGAMLVAIIALCPALAASAQKVMVVPFGLNAPEDLSYLKSGVVDMLTSRLNREGHVSVIAPAPDRQVQDESDARRLAAELEADFIVLGTLTVLGSHVSTDARVIDVAENRNVLSFARSGKARGELIGHIDQLAAEINTRLFGRNAATTAPAAPQAPPAPTPQAPGIYQHPEKLLNPSGQARPIDESGATPYGVAGTPSLLVRGPKLRVQLRGVAAGDVDGDGHNEIVCIDGNSLIAYRIKQGRLVKFAKIKGTGSYLGVNTADLNANGMAEIFVTNYDTLSGRVLSFVLEWKDQRLERIADQLPWYFRSVVLPDRSTYLVGQRQGMDDPFVPGIYKIVSREGSYDRGERLVLPPKLNVFGSNYGNIQSPSGAADVVAYSKEGYVQMLDAKGNANWSSTERYGGSNTFIKFDDKEDPGEKVYLFMAAPMHLYDIDGDGRQEIWVVKNDEAVVGKAFSSSRSFTQGRIEALQWDELGLRTVWKTRNLAKYIADFTLADVDGDARPEVVAVVVSKKDGIISKPDSYIAIFKLGSGLQSK